MRKDSWRNYSRADFRNVIYSSFLQHPAILIYFLLSAKIASEASLQLKEPNMDIDEDKLTLISEEYKASVIIDDNGNEITPLGVKKQTYQGQNGEVVIKEIMQNTILADGRVWNSSLALRPGKDAIFVSTCPSCKPKNGKPELTLASEMRRCYSCGKFVCSRCIKISSDNHLCCKSCNRKYKIGSFFRWVFFERKD
jgi:hypothetical protein